MYSVCAKSHEGIFHLWIVYYILPLIGRGLFNFFVPSFCPILPVLFVIFHKFLREFSNFSLSDDFGGIFWQNLSGIFVVEDV